MKKTKFNESLILGIRKEQEQGNPLFTNLLWPIHTTDLQ